jgi:hypothetical protein
VAEYRSGHFAEASSDLIAAAKGDKNNPMNHRRNGMEQFGRRGERERRGR